MRTDRRRVATALTVAMLLQVAVVTAASAQTPISVERLAGANRYATAVAVSQAAWPQGSDTVFVVTGQDFADALSVSAAAVDIGPVLLVERDRVPVETATELRRLRPQHVVVVGGTAVISPATEIELARYAEEVTVRVAGADRYATAVEVSRTFVPEPPERVYVASGVTHQDALAAAAVAGGLGAPVLLTAPRTLPASTASELERLAPQQIVVVGDAGDVSEGVLGQIGAYGPTVRIAGADDAETSALLSLDAYESSPAAVLATVADYPDALAGAAFAGNLPVPMLLTDPDEVPDAVACELLRLGVEQVAVLGGPGAVSRAVVEQLEAGFDVGELEGCDLAIVREVPGAPLYDLVTSKDQRTAYIVNNRWNRVEVLDLQSRRFQTPIPVGSDPVDIDIAPDGRTLYVTNFGSQDISVVDVATGQERVDRAGRPDRIQFPTSDGDDQVDPERSFMLAVGQSNRAIFASTTFASGGGLDLFELDLGAERFTRLPVPPPPDREPTAVGGFDILVEDIVPTNSGPVAELVIDGILRRVSVNTVIGTTDDGTTTVTRIESPEVEFTTVSDDPESEPVVTVLLLPTDTVVRLERSPDHRFVAMSVGGNGLLVADTAATDLEFTTIGTRTGGAAVEDLAVASDGSLLMDDGGGTAFVVGPADTNAPERGHRLLGTVTSAASASFGLWLAGDGDTAYRLTDAGVEVIDVDRFLVEEPCTLPLAAPLAGNAGKNQQLRGTNQIALAVDGDDVTLVVVNEIGVQLFLDPPTSDSPCAFEPTA